MDSPFKAQVQKDLACVFLNPDEFTSLHIIDGTQLLIVVDNDMLKERQTKKEYAYEGDILFYVQKTIYGDAPAIGQIVNYDGEIYRVSDFQEDDGLYSITLVANQS
jgi:hypothetical protein